MLEKSIRRNTMNVYENLIILDTNLYEKSPEESLEKIKNFIIKQGGEILKTDIWGRKKLAYELKKHKDGVYVLLIFKAPPQAIVELERFYKISDLVFKFLVIKLNKKQIEAAFAPDTKQETATEDETKDKSAVAEGLAQQ
jgi:small subunit ribosomal protein S6